MELRNRVRFRLSAAAVFAWQGASGQRLLGEGLTRDISVTGTFIFTKTTPPVGAIVDLKIFLSYPVGKGSRSVQIKTRVEVIRVDHEVNCEGFGAISRDFTLLFDRNGRKVFGISSIDNIP
jgi:hypothetical protein